MSPDPSWRPPEPPGRPPHPPVPPRAPNSRSRWLPWVFLGLLVTALLVYQGLPKGGEAQASLTYSEFLSDVRTNKVDTIRYESSNGHITGQFKKGVEVDGKKAFSTTGPTNSDARCRHRAPEHAQRRPRLQEPGLEHHRLDPHAVTAGRAHPRILRLDESTRAGTDGRGDEHRALAREGLQHREAEDDVRRRRRIRPGEGRDQGGRRLPEDAGQVPRHRRAHPEGRAARRASGHRQDADRARGRR